MQNKIIRLKVSPPKALQPPEEVMEARKEFLKNQAIHKKMSASIPQSVKPIIFFDTNDTSVQPKSDCLKKLTRKNTGGEISQVRFSSGDIRARPASRGYSSWRTRHARDSIQDDNDEELWEQDELVMAKKTKKKSKAATKKKNDKKNKKKKKKKKKKKICIYIPDEV